MKIKSMIFLFFVTLYLISVKTILAESPLSAKHTITNYSVDSTSITLNFSMHIENLKDTPLYNITLFHVPTPVNADEGMHLNIGTLNAYETIDVSFSFESPMLLTEQEVSEEPLFWIGEYYDENNNLIDFPVASHCILGGENQ